MNIQNPVCPPCALHAVNALYLRLVVLLTLAVTSSAFAQATPEAFQKNMDEKAGVFCKYVNILPQSKWVTLVALVFFIIGAILMIFGGRGGNVYLFRGIGAVVIIPALISLGSSFGIVC